MSRRTARRGLGIDYSEPASLFNWMINTIDHGVGESGSSFTVYQSNPVCFGEKVLGETYTDEVMFYGGNSFLHPRDDAPRVVDVFHNPNLRQYLEVGTGKPAALYVLYPWQGEEVLCRGAVMPYHEFRSDKRLTDDDWRAMLDSGKTPAQPDWLSALTAAGTARAGTGE